MNACAVFDHVVAHGLPPVLLYSATIDTMPFCGTNQRAELGAFRRLGLWSRDGTLLYNVKFGSTRCLGDNVATLLVGARFVNSALTNG